LETAWRQSPCFLAPGADAAALAGAMTLHPALVPADLYSRADADASATAAGGRGEGYWSGAAARAAAAEAAGGLFERLEALERRGGDGGAPGDPSHNPASSADPRSAPLAAAPPADGDDDDARPPGPAEESDDDADGDDDYLVGEAFDDDDGYGDDDDGNGEPTF
jgi:hypothetical protein